MEEKLSKSNIEVGVVPATTGMCGLSDSQWETCCRRCFVTRRCNEFASLPSVFFARNIGVKRQRLPAITTGLLWFKRLEQGGVEHE